jgi:hypothetical protein
MAEIIDLAARLAQREAAWRRQVEAANEVIRGRLETSGAVSTETRAQLAASLHDILQHVVAQLGRGAKGEVVRRANIGTDEAPTKVLDRHTLPGGLPPEEKARRVERLAAKPRNYLRFAVAAAERLGLERDYFLADLVEGTQLAAGIGPDALGEIGPYSAISRVLRHIGHGIARKRRLDEAFGFVERHELALNSEGTNFESATGNLYRLDDILPRVDLFTIRHQASEPCWLIPPTVITPPQQYPDQETVRSLAAAGKILEGRTVLEREVSLCLRPRRERGVRLHFRTTPSLRAWPDTGFWRGRHWQARVPWPDHGWGVFSDSSNNDAVGWYLLKDEARRTARARRRMSGGATNRSGTTS